jgi:hypothetical protein
MWPGHVGHVDGLAICGGLGGAATIVSEAVLNADDNPG